MCLDSFYFIFVCRKQKICKFTKKWMKEVHYFAADRRLILIFITLKTPQPDTITQFHIFFSLLFIDIAIYKGRCLYSTISSFHPFDFWLKNWKNSFENKKKCFIRITNSALHGSMSS